MNSKELREYFQKAYQFSQDEIDTIMGNIKNHVEYVIGKDKSYPATSAMEDRAIPSAINTEKAEQRNRAGGY